MVHYGWRKFYDSASPNTEKLPEPWDLKLQGLDRFGLLSTFVMLDALNHDLINKFSSILEPKMCKYKSRLPPNCLNI